MNSASVNWLAPAKNLVSTTSLTLALSLFTSAAGAQQSVSELFNAFDVTKAAAMEKLVEINDDPATQEARDEFKMQLEMMANMSMRDAMAAGMGHGGMVAGTDGPFGELEVQARVTLIGGLRSQPAGSDAEAAFENSAPLNRHTAEVFKRGRNFENQLYAIYTNNSITDKQAAVAGAVEEYLSDNRHSVGTAPKNSVYLISHPHASAFKFGFPKISGLLWSNQWMRLAALEAAILEHLDQEFAGGLDIVKERYWSKVGSAGGMTMFPAPSELPRAPAITPNLYSQSEQAAIILDNLNTLDAVIADILAYPNLGDRGTAIDEVVAEFTNKETNLSDTYDYLLFALRGGIYNQGGPAIGELAQSERNRSRSAMDMEHSMIMSSPQ
ncbi:MAG TPA: hypothetical protein EYO00_01665 [Gammaproteobacteria bacterium]|jgi:hypothetical protein|nr:hypothetical protein [Gammaproteobacteria bacterium]HIF87918.1 hypothetical protein [Gammaproteobacteria bacterium]HIL63943.1 hypothetical protein [Porticoccaceae bacterium]HIN90014.1 hypothetical protein [Porticoccaceae bacterium]|tara:strand:- start:5939 stop:7087 length:1149 start_codon:yes stop_codon:yes gene_type:complete